MQITSGYFRQNASKSSFNLNQSWVILSPIEQRIKEKIEAVGTPLKDWNINIYRGILTGYNEAFIIDGKKKDELIAEDPKSAEIIRPILRGRDIKRYRYEFADLYLIATFPSLKIDIDHYPAVKQHLLSFGYDRLKQTGEPGARKKTNNKWFETQDSISYWEDFYKQKIIYPNMTKFLPFYYDDNNFLTNQKCFIITGEKVEFLTAFFNSSLFKYCFRENFPELLGGTRELSKIFFDKIPVLRISEEVNLEFKNLVAELQKLRKINKPSEKILLQIKELEILIDYKIFELYSLTQNEMKEVGVIEIQ
jgi:adenine-specific DNA-methyltransferase